jgi:hypothetical protein
MLGGTDDIMIPKVINYCWFGKNPKSAKEINCINSWIKFCPDYQIIEWNENNYNFSAFDYMKEAYDAKKWSFVSDVVRLDIIDKYGGIYLDTDVELVRSFDDLLHLHAFMGIEKNGAINTGLGFGAEKGNEIIHDLLYGIYGNRKFLDKDGNYITTPCTELTMKYLNEKYHVDCGKVIQQIKNVNVFSVDYFCPMDYETGEINLTENTHSIHHYQASWLSDAEKKSIKFSRKVNKLVGIKIGRIITRPILKIAIAIARIQQQGLLKTLKYYLKKIRIIIK